jgi:solute carrier family 25 2-oxodicarboxylate transporter 21
MEAPKRALKFASNEVYKPIFANKKTGALSQWGSVGAGLCALIVSCLELLLLILKDIHTHIGIAAGVTEGFFVVPFELVKIRLQAKENVRWLGDLHCHSFCTLLTLFRQLGKYRNTFDACVKIFKSEGLMGFYRGIESTVQCEGNFTH